MAWHACSLPVPGNGEATANWQYFRCLPKQGFQRVADNLADTALDNPRAKDEFPTIVESAQRAGWLESNFEACHSAVAFSTHSAWMANLEGCGVSSAWRRSSLCCCLERQPPDHPSNRP